MSEAQHSQKSTDFIQARHQVKGGVYLVVADNSDEFFVALKYAAKMAHANGCHLGVLRVMEQQDFQHWGGVEARMRQEQQDEAEAAFAEISARLEEYEDMTVGFYLEEGGGMETVLRVIEEDPNITMLILGGKEQGGGPGPLVSYLAGKGLAKLGVPIMIVPEHLSS